MAYKHDIFKHYIKWLMDKIGGDYYENLLYFLWQIDYVPEYELDQNWYQRGMDLRYEFWKSTVGNFDVPGYDDRKNFKKNCSILEMMVALSIEAADRIGNGAVWSDPKDWFHAMIENLGLSQSTNSNFELYRTFVGREIDNIMAHQIDKLGGPYNWFVLDRHDLSKIYDGKHVDMSKMDIWHQLNCWIRTKSDAVNIFERENVELIKPVEE